MKKKWTLIAKLRLCFAAMIGLAFLVGGLALLYNTRLSRELQTAVDVVARKQLLAGQISTAASDMTALERGIAFSAVLTQAGKMETLKGQFSQAAALASNALQDLNQMNNSDEARQSIRELEKAHQGVLSAHAEMLRLFSNQQMDIALQKFDSDVAPRLQDIANAARRMIELQGKDLVRMSVDASERKTTTNVLMVSLVALSLMAGVLVLITLRNATKALRGLTGEINVCATEVSEASKQIAHASQSLSVGASRQAGSLEETSASSQEMSSMTQTNADNSRRAAEVMSEVDREVQEANQTLEQMKSSMAEINGSSEKIAKIAATGFRRYLARLGGDPAGGGNLRLCDGVAQLCGAATLPTFRRRGIQTAMLFTRLQDAGDAGCDIAVVTTEPGSKSQQNVQRSGFGLLYSRAVLIKAPPPRDRDAASGAMLS